MSEKVVQLRAVEGGFDFDALFESLKGSDYSTALVLTVTADGRFEWFGNCTAEEANFFLDKAKAWLLKGEELA